MANDSPRCRCCFLLLLLLLHICVVVVVVALLLVVVVLRRSTPRRPIPPHRYSPCKILLGVALLLYDLCPLVVVAGSKDFPSLLHKNGEAMERKAFEERPVYMIILYI